METTFDFQLKLTTFIFQDYPRIIHLQIAGLDFFKGYFNLILIDCHNYKFKSFKWHIDMISRLINIRVFDF